MSKWSKEIVVSEGTPLPHYQLEAFKTLIRKAELKRVYPPEKKPSLPAAQRQELHISTDTVAPPRHIIHKAIQSREMLESGEFKSQTAIAKQNGLTRARVTQIMNLLKLPTEWKKFLVQLKDNKEISKYSERKLRKYRLSKMPCSICPNNGTVNHHITGTPKKNKKGEPAEITANPP